MPWGIFRGSVIVLDVLGWGLFWSALLRNALAAAALAVCTTGLAVPIVDTGLNLARPYGDEWPIELGLAIVTTIASAGLFVKLGPPRRALFPGLPTRTTSARTRPEPIVAERPAVAASGMSSALRLAWQSLRQIGRVWWWMFLIALFVPVLLSLWNRSPDDSLYWFLFQVGIAIVAGIGVFGAENPARTYRFLAHHGARPSRGLAGPDGGLGRRAGSPLGTGRPRHHALRRAPANPSRVARAGLVPGPGRQRLLRDDRSAGASPPGWSASCLILTLAPAGSMLAYMGMMPAWVLSWFPRSSWP